MERSLGAEIATTFGERLKRLYAQDEQSLPPQVSVSLERLKRAEQALREETGPSAGFTAQSAPR